MDMAARCGYMKFSLYGEEGDDMVEGLENFKYLGRILDQMDDDWIEVRQKTMRARLLWRRLGTMLIW